MSDDEEVDIVKQAQKLSGDTRLLADVVDEMRGVEDYDLVADLFGGTRGMGQISALMKNAANFMDKGTGILNKLNQRFGDN